MIIDDIGTIDKKYDVIYADPAWSYTDKCNSGKRGAGFKYPCMNLSDLMQLPVKRLAADNCFLFMWHVGPMPLEALKLVEAWGFTFKNMKAFTWVKKTKNGLDHFGMGNYTRANSEDCLIAVKGRPKRVDASVRQIVKAAKRAHSQKPDEVRDRIVKLAGDDKNFIELFARHEHKLWDCWGNEIESVQLNEVA
ncbi:MT-A70 family methyltransferase [Paraglaciecola psychrophila]|jgi:N6-adenosine-specific RNA methylase IME4|uniref:Adenine methylase n=1 Tax=Paraglaciecola psychrophila 170 TaxID=1129794 RepID=K6YVV6_9ALTE|nr:MT-A70 family methyltransferase [Paraglaciecola psychrophila]AGH44489.1 adenine methylase [Paraglaciecola psychrophila 170]GAC36834.1 modification methylase MunI [Paraglaciecola psychrophila 170]